MMSGGASGSKKKQKAAIYHQKTKEWDKKFEELQLQRPQDTHPDLMRRMRQMNFGTVHIDPNPNLENILNWKPAEECIQSRSLNKKCYETGAPNPKWVQTTEEFKTFMETLKKCPEFTLDVEVCNHHTLTDFICLIQIGTWDYGDYILDPFVIHNEISTELKTILESVEYMKICHDLTNDVRWIQKDFGIFIAAAVDVQIMYRLLYGETAIGFTKLAMLYYPELKHLFHEETLSDWRLRPGNGLTYEQEIYATNDVHVLLRVFNQLRAEMLERKPPGNMFILACEETKTKLKEVSPALQKKASEIDYEMESRNELRLLSTRKDKPTLRPIVSYLSEDEKKIFCSMIEWRSLMAKIIDEKPFKAVQPEKLLSLAKLKSPDILQIKRILGSVDKRISDLTSSQPWQAEILKKIIETDGEYIAEIRKIECHNCLKTGHGPAWACPFPKIRENYRAWLNREENSTTRENLNQRRFEKLSQKVGEAKAREIFKRNSSKK